MMRTGETSSAVRSTRQMVLMAASICRRQWQKRFMRIFLPACRCSAIICRAPKAVQPAPQPRMAARQRLRRSHSRHSLLIQRADREARMRLRPVIRAALPSHLRQLSQLQRHSPLRQQLSQLQQLSRPRQRPSRLQRHPPAMVPPRPIRDRTAQLHRLLPAVHLPAVRGPDLVGPRVLRVVPAIHRAVHPAPA